MIQKIQHSDPSKPLVLAEFEPEHTMVIGSGPGVDVRLDGDPWIYPRHLEITCHYGDYVVRDARRPAQFLNGRIAHVTRPGRPRTTLPYGRWRKLVPGTMIELDSYRLVWVREPDWRAGL